MNSDKIALPDKVEIPSAIADKIPAGMPEWAVFVIAGFALALIIFILVKIGDVIFKVALAAVTVIFIYLLISGRIDIPVLSPFFESLAEIIAGWFR
jgi:hypothetical protein